MTTPHRHAARDTWWSRIADVLHRFVTKRRPARAVGSHVYRWTPAGSMVMARGLLHRIEVERTQAAAARTALREECERMARLLSGVRRGRADAARFAHAVSRTKSTQRVAPRQRFAGPARFINVSRATRTAVRTAGRETVAVAARAVRQVGAHRHVKGVNDAAHELAASALATIKSYRTTRANGENSIWTTPRGLPA